MAYNIQMNYFDGSNYNELLPKTKAENVFISNGSTNIYDYVNDKVDNLSIYNNLNIGDIICTVSNIAPGGFEKCNGKINTSLELQSLLIDTDIGSNFSSTGGGRLNGKDVPGIICGGMLWCFSSTDASVSIHLFDPSKRTFSSKASFSYSKTILGVDVETAAKLSDNVYIFGGSIARDSGAYDSHNGECWLVDLSSSSKNKILSTSIYGQEKGCSVAYIAYRDGIVAASGGGKPYHLWKYQNDTNNTFKDQGVLNESFTAKEINSAIQTSSAGSSSNFVAISGGNGSSSGFLYIYNFSEKRFKEIDTGEKYSIQFCDNRYVYLSDNYKYLGTGTSTSASSIPRATFMYNDELNEFYYKEGSNLTKVTNSTNSKTINNTTIPTEALYFAKVKNRSDKWYYIVYDEYHSSEDMLYFAAVPQYRRPYLKNNSINGQPVYYYIKTTDLA